jgi:peptidoglycan/xylan/chitin deacetylase (PgdA/CDA1 family)
MVVLGVVGFSLAVRAGWPLAWQPAAEPPDAVQPEPPSAALTRPAEAPEAVAPAVANTAPPPAAAAAAGPPEMAAAAVPPEMAAIAGPPETAAVIAPLDRRPLPPRWPESGPVVALTFDAGADRGYAEDILDTLRAARAPASFGVTGRWAEENPELVRRMAADGHQVINHTLDHRSFTGLSDELGGLSAARRRQELEDAEVILAPLIGHTTRPWYRLPYGDDADGISVDAAAAGFTRKAGWTIDSLGWRGLGAGDIVARCLKLAEPDAIYVFHVSHTSQDGPALARIIAGVRERGLGFATLEQLE